MNKLACRYAIIQFMPYTETGEFANVGIVLVCPKTGFFGFQLQTKRYARITAFFDELKSRVYTDTVRVFEQELSRIQSYLSTLPQVEKAQIIRDTFAHLIHPREAMIRFGEERSLLVDSPEQAVQDLFRHYVEREFATQEYIETRIEHQLTTLLKGLALESPFRKERIGNDEIHATFPLVQRQEGITRKIIKPFNLSHDEPNGIYDHGSLWAQKMKRLRNRGLLPDRVLFAVAAPPEQDTKRRAAYMEICEELREQNIVVTAANQEQEIAQFAKAS